MAAATRAALPFARLIPALREQFVAGCEVPARHVHRIADAAAEARELRSRLRRALGQLAPRVAEVFVLRALEGIPNRQIARLLGSSPAVIAVQYFRARTQLRKELLTEGGGPS